ncbi:MAG: DUF2232 domain-containing protein [Ghiorsea sp.]
MSEESKPLGITMPRVVEMFLTNRVLCAALAVMMLSSVYWFDMLFGNLKLIAFIFLLVGVVLHLAVPSLFAVVTLGGGLKYSLQVGAIAALLLLALSSGSVYTSIVFLMLFVLLPVFATQTMQNRGLGQAAWLLALVLFTGFAVVMMIGASPQGLEAFVHQQFQSVFDDMIARIPPEAKDDIISMHSLQDMMVKVFPGFFVLGLWLVWWVDLILAQKVAVKYGFYQGVSVDVLSLTLPKSLVYVLLVLMAFANIASGNMQYVAFSGAIVLAGLIALQGVIVGHAWMKNRGMGNAIIVMYVMLFFWSFVIVIFTFIGLLDIWFNFRRNFISTTGEK